HHGLDQVVLGGAVGVGEDGDPAGFADQGDGVEGGQLPAFDALHQLGAGPQVPGEGVLEAGDVFFLHQGGGEMRAAHAAGGGAGRQFVVVQLDALCRQAVTDVAGPD